MADYDLDKIDDLLNIGGMDEAYFVGNLKSMIDKGGQNAGPALKMLGDLKGLGKKQTNVQIGILDSLGMSNLLRSVQDNRRLNSTPVEVAEVIDDKD